MGPPAPEDIVGNTARDLAQLAGDLNRTKADVHHWLQGAEYATLLHRLEGAHAAVEAANTSGEILAAVLGALVGALAVFLFTEWREARRRVRTLIGYAKLLDAEIEADHRVMATLQESGLITWDELVEYHGEAPPSDEVWKAVREPLAAMIRVEDFDALNEYYRRLRVHLVLQGRPGRAEYKIHPKHLPAQAISSELMAETPKLRSMLSQYANPPRRVRLLGF